MFAIDFVRIWTVQVRIGDLKSLPLLFDAKVFELLLDHRTYMKYVKSDDEISTVCGLFVMEFLFCGLMPSVMLSSTAMNKVSLHKKIMLRLY